MDWDRIEGNWKQVKGKVKEQWGKLTDDDLDHISGKRVRAGGQDTGAVRHREGSRTPRRRRSVRASKLVASRSPAARFGGWHTMDSRHAPPVPSRIPR